MTYGTDTPPETGSTDLFVRSVANPRRVRLDADGRPEPVAPAKHPSHG